MPVQMGMWRIDGDRPRPLTATPLALESQLESFLARDSSLLGMHVLVIGQQVATPHGKRIDLLAIDADGELHILELKRDRTPRDVVAQVLDYGSWVSTLERQDVVDIAEKYLKRPFESAFVDEFGTPAPDEISADLHLTVVASELDASSERIVTYLRTFGVPVNAVFFSHLEDGDRNYLARAWLADEEATVGPVKPRAKASDWNGQDWFVNAGVDPSGRQWEDCCRYGFLGANGGKPYTRALRGIPEGARVNAYISQAGYVGVGEVLAPAQRFEQAVVRVGNDEVRLRDQELIGDYSSEGLSDDDAHWVLPVRWIVDVPQPDAYFETGLFSNPNVACKLRQQFTLDKLAEHFGLNERD